MYASVKTIKFADIYNNIHVMKKFLLNVLSSAIGVILSISIIAVLLGVFALSAVIGSAGKSSVKVKSHSVLKIDLKGVLSERSQDTPLATLGMAQVNPSLESMLQAIKVAKNNKNIDGIYIAAGVVSANPASLQELRRALDDFKKSGKFVVSYAGTYSQGAYYVCSAGSQVFLNPIGEIEWRGLGGEMMFYKDLLKKIGVEMQVVKVGTYKSAVEPFTATEMSPANREQVTQYITSIWNNIKKEVSASRNIPVAQLDTLADRYVAMLPPNDVLASKLIDKLVYEDDALKEVARLVGEDEADDVDYVSVGKIAPLAAQDNAGDEVAVYYATGEIVSGAEEGSLFSNAIVASKMIDDLEELADEDDVKAVVIRVNSGGGSAYASEQIWHAVKKLAGEKPVVVSMGDMAASGAYYLSCGAQYIIAEPTTLTGSIGIFGMIPDASLLMKDKLGLRFDGVKTNAHSDFGSTSRPFNASETAMLQSYVDRGYDLFTTRVSEGRHISKQKVDEIAQGRVWTGEDALKIKLVDRLGNLDDAVEEAAKRAGVKKYHAVHYPEAKEWWEEILDSKMEDYTMGQMRAYLGEFYPAFEQLRTIDRQDRVQARIPFAPVVK